MKELIRVTVQYASRQQCCKTHNRPFPLPYLILLSVDRKVTIFWHVNPSNLVDVYRHCLGFDLSSHMIYMFEVITSYILQNSRVIVRNLRYHSQRIYLQGVRFKTEPTRTASLAVLHFLI